MIFLITDKKNLTTFLTYQTRVVPQG